MWKKIKIRTESGREEDAQAPIIISASRSTDIPAFYSDWFVHRLKKGYLKWINPFNRKPLFVTFQKARVLVFWSKNPKPIIKHLDFIKTIIPNFYFQYTLNNYDAENLEVNVPSVDSRIDTFIELSNKIGKDKVIWRFDPLILTDKINCVDLLEKIKYVGDKIHKYTDKLVFSFADIESYKKVKKNLLDNKINYKEFDEESMRFMAKGIQELNKNWGLKIGTCAEAINLKEYGIEHNKCVDDDLMIKLFKDDEVLMKFLGVKLIKADILDKSI